MTVDRDVTRAERIALVTLSDGAWHDSRRSVGHGFVLSTVAAALWRRGLVEREGASRTVKPSNPGYRYRILPAGRSML